MPLVIAPIHQELRVIKILCNDKTRKHLESLGITINSVITVLSSTGGNVVLKVKEGRLALDSTIATGIVVA